MTSADRLIQKGIEQGIAKGVEQGIAKGIEQGIAKGVEQGIAKGIARVVERQLALKFGALPEHVLERLRGADTEQLQVWSERVLTAMSLAEVMDGDAGGNDA